MKQLMARHILLIVALVGLAFVLGLAGHAVLAQGSDAVDSGRGEAAEGPSERGADTTEEPLSPLDVEALGELYHFAGVLNVAGSRGTAVQCTNVDDELSTWIQVNLYDYDGTPVDSGSIYVAPFRTVTFESTAIAFYIADVAMGAASVEQGYGRILAEHGNVVCTVQVLDAVNNPPVWSMDIPVYRRAPYGAMLPVILNNATP